MSETYPGNWAETVRRVGERTLRWQQGCYYWGDAIAYDGLLAVDASLKAGWSEELAARLRRWYEVAPNAWDDALAPGAAAAALVRAGLLDEAVLDRIVTAMTVLPTSDGVPLLRPHVPAWRTLVWVDSVYHLPITLVEAGLLRGSEELIDRGVDIAARTVALLRAGDAVGHAHDTGLGRGTGIRWTRGIGWALLGLLDVVAAVPEAAAEAGLDGAARDLLAALDGAQRSDGHWPTVLEESNADPETSVAGFWLAAHAHPAAAGFPSATTTSTTLALTALTDRIGDDGTVEGVSHDTHVTWSVKDYLHPATLPSPWGQGAALRALAAFDDVTGVRQ